MATRGMTLSNTIAGIRSNLVRGERWITLIVPELDALVRECGLVLSWDTRTERYLAPKAGASSSVSLHTRYTPPPFRTADELSPERQIAREFERALAAAYKTPSYLALFTASKNVRRAEAILRRRFPMGVFNLDSEIIAAMRGCAQRLGADWDVVLCADAAPSDSQDWRRLQQLLRQALLAVEEKLRARKGPLLMTYPGLLARYGEMSLLSRLSDGRLAYSLWVLVAGDQQTGRPTIDGARRDWMSCTAGMRTREAARRRFSS